MNRKIFNLLKGAASLKGEELIKKCQKGNAKAQSVLYEKYATPMYRLCCRYIKDQVEAEDVLVRGFYQVFRKLDSFLYQDEPKLSSWIRRIMVNECLMQLRQAKQFHFIHLAEETEFADSSHLHIDSHLSADDIYAFLLELPVNYRTIFNLFVIEGFSHREIAEQLEISEEASRSQLSRAKAMLRVILTKNDIRNAI